MCPKAGLQFWYCWQNSGLVRIVRKFAGENCFRKKTKNRTVKLHVLCPSLAVACTACILLKDFVYMLYSFTFCLIFCPLSTLKSLETEMKPGQDF